MEPMVVMAANAAKKVGHEILRAHLNRHRLDLAVESKGLDGLVTQIDRYAEQLTIATLQESYPNHSYLGEEFGLQEGKGADAEWCWVIDPLDGTQNFVHGVPHFCVSIAVQKNGITEHGVVYDPVRDELFSASRGRGAVMNQRRLQVSDRKTIAGGLFTTGHPYERMVGNERVSFAKQHFASLQAICENGGQVRRFGSAALDLCYVAAGRFDGYFEMSIKPWDIAAGELIVSEARGVVVDHQGASNAMQTGSVFACNVKLLKPLMQLVVPRWENALG
ncbi:myo-inositol-1(or 4)-monophosphatase [Moraxella cuniculi DSM 21768]|uniref:Inositol-1-monophosphatase n=2 Tax=Moraxella cuniculi TaxID=34061 RepID=A0A1N7E679_9GAMM|nr:inositol monophosphatase family protein [Moraxella cuniculi]OOS06618.1 inositol monophosphatase [Moraxella cuniculi]SIR83539.1 myo-inositol-1(or 4)-monophosphatase [Moraxella cuniculi DSM 21768]VEG12813.1 Inositol-1-monophosphatase [Moraxella cuniculi]